VDVIWHFERWPTNVRSEELREPVGRLASWTFLIAAIDPATLWRSDRRDGAVVRLGLTSGLVGGRAAAVVALSVLGTALVWVAIAVAAIVIGILMIAAILAAIREIR
jgi:hypothetical protein